MIELKAQYPYIDEDGVIKNDLIKHYAEDEIGNKYYIKQIQTGILYDAAVDVFPCKYAYMITDKMIEKEDNGKN